VIPREGVESVGTHYETRKIPASEVIPREGVESAALESGVDVSNVDDGRE